jgi:hypothetical protein
MPYDEPKKTEKGWVLPKKEGGLHKSQSGKVVHFKSKESAEKAGKAIMISEHIKNKK